MKFKCFYAWDQLPQTADELFSKAENDSLFFSRQWFENLSTTALEQSQHLLLVCVLENNSNKNPELASETDNILAILPLISRDNKEWTSLSHIYTSLYTVLMADNNQQAILRCLAKGLSQLPFDSLTLVSVAEDDDNMNSLQSFMESFGLSCACYAQFFNWYHQLKGHTFSDYIAERPSRVRNTIARKQRKLKREHDYEIRLHIGGDVVQAMTDYYAVYNNSWKSSERFENIIEGFISSFSKLGWIRLAILYIDNQPVATQIWFVVHKKASIFKLAYNETWKQYSPGSILTKYLMEYVIDVDKVEEIDFLIGNDRYKQEWMSERRRRWRFVYTHKQEPQRNANKLLKSIKNGLKILG